jgi:hypothetical protein
MRGTWHRQKKDPKYQFDTPLPSKGKGLKAAGDAFQAEIHDPGNFQQRQPLGGRGVAAVVGVSVRHVAITRACRPGRRR